MTGPRLEMKNIRKEYFGNKVLKGVNISVEPGEIHAIVGENGAGKSTLMNILGGLDRPSLARHSSTAKICSSSPLAL